MQLRGFQKFLERRKKQEIILLKWLPWPNQYLNFRPLAIKTMTKWVSVLSYIVYGTLLWQHYHMRVYKNLWEMQFKITFILVKIIFEIYIFPLKYFFSFIWETERKRRVSICWFISWMPNPTRAGARQEPNHLSHHLRPLRVWDSGAEAMFWTQHPDVESGLSPLG